MTIAPTSITLADLTITKQGDDTFSNSPLDHFVHKLQTLPNFDGVINYIVSSDKEADAFWQRAQSASGMAELSRQADTTTIPTVHEQEKARRALWRKLDQKWADFTLPQGMPGFLNRANITYLGDIAHRLESEVRAEAGFTFKQGKCSKRMKEILDQYNLTFDMGIQGWQRPEART